MKNIESSKIYEQAVKLLNSGSEAEAELILLEQVSSPNCSLVIHDLYTFLMQKMNKLDEAFNSACYVIERSADNALYLFRASEVSYRRNEFELAFVLALNSFENKKMGDGSPELFRIVDLVQMCLRKISGSSKIQFYKSIFLNKIAHVSNEDLIYKVLPFLATDLVDRAELQHKLLGEDSGLLTELDLTEEVLFKYLANNLDSFVTTLISKNYLRLDLNLLSYRIQFCARILSTPFDLWVKDEEFITLTIESELHRTDLFFEKWSNRSINYFAPIIERWSPVTDLHIDFKRYLLALAYHARNMNFEAYELLRLIQNPSFVRKTSNLMLSIQVLHFKNPVGFDLLNSKFLVDLKDLSNEVQKVYADLKSYKLLGAYKFSPNFSPSVGANANICVFVKTYPRDYQWLGYLLKSISKNLTGYSEIVLLTDDKEDLFPSELKQLCINLDVKVFYTSIPSWCRIKNKPGYWWQQVCKMQFYKWSTCDFAFFVDSDCFFERKFDIQSDRFNNDKPVILRRPWNRVGSGQVWRYAIDYLFGSSDEWSYMQRNGLIMSAHVLKEFERYLRENFDFGVEEFFLEPTNALQKSEFEIFGAFVSRFFPDDFCFIDVKPSDGLVQFRSWDGIDASVENRMLTALSNAS